MSAVIGQSFVYSGGGERATGQREGVGCFKGEQTIKDMWVESTNIRD